MINVTVDRDTRMKEVHWQVSKFCEKACHYCTAYQYKLSTKRGKHVVEYPDDVLKLHDNIAYLLPRVIDHGQILLFGGEPTLHPNGIKYFNDMCEYTKNNRDVVIFLVTHGDISEEKILSLNNHGKKEHFISISYHYYQHDFEEWFEKVKLFHKHNNIIVSSIIPRRPKVWDQWQKNMEIVLDSGMPVEIKAELEKKENTIDWESVKRFKHMIYRAYETVTPTMRKHLTQSIYLKEGNEQVEINHVNLMGELPVRPHKTLCRVKEFSIQDDMLFVTCDEGRKLRLTPNTTIDEMNEYLADQITVCTKDRCIADRHNPAEMTIMTASLKDDDFKEFIGNST